MAAIVTAAALTGCGVDDPYNDPQPPAKTAASTPTPSPTPSPTAQAGAPTSERAALEQFARAWSTWTYATLPDVRRRLADMASGELRASLLHDAEDAAESFGSASENRGTVEGVMLRAGKPAIVVTHEESRLLDGQYQEAYVVYLARAEETPTGWKVVEWTPV